jgi:nucleotide-binding universal stress UspA family protein
MRTLVVGVDGSSSSLGALQWASDQVGAAGELYVLVATTPKPELADHRPKPGSIDDLFMLEHELDRVSQASVRDRVGSVTVQAVAGAASDALREAALSHGADAIVLGTHMSALGLPKRIGSTLRDLMADLRCPLVVVPDPVGPGVPDGPIVVGVGYGPATDAAVCWAAARAEEGGQSLAIVRATGEGPVFQIDGWLAFVAYYIDPKMRDQWTEEDLNEFARRAQEATSADISIATEALKGLPATQLVDESERAALLVIGQHRTRGLGTRHVAQPLHHALTHAQCPVVVVPAEPEDSDDVDSAA